MILSPFNSIFFLGIRKSPGVECPYIQTFAHDDNVLFEIIRTTDEPPASVDLVNAVTGIDVITLTRQTYSVGADEVVDCFNLNNIDDGFYYLAIGDNESETFRITSDPEILKFTSLIEYSTADNRSRRDVVGIAENKRLYFSFRIPGGFKANGWSFSVDNEQFVTSMSDIVELYGRESTQLSLTMGLSQGVPIWFGELLNRLLTCRYVYIDGERYARFESSVPEIEQPIEYVNSFIFTQKLQRINYLEPHKTTDQ